jgi:hypothetical protein
MGKKKSKSVLNLHILVEGKNQNELDSNLDKLARKLKNFMNDSQNTNGVIEFDFSTDEEK